MTVSVPPSVLARGYLLPRLNGVLAIRAAPPMFSSHAHRLSPVPTAPRQESHVTPKNTHRPPPQSLTATALQAPTLWAQVAQVTSPCPVHAQGSS